MILHSSRAVHQSDIFLLLLPLKYSISTRLKIYRVPDAFTIRRNGNSLVKCQKANENLCFPYLWNARSLKTRIKRNNGGPVKYRGIVSPFLPLFPPLFYDSSVRGMCIISSSRSSIYSFNRAPCLEVRTSMITSLLRVSNKGFRASNRGLKDIRILLLDGKEKKISQKNLFSVEISAILE